MLLRIALCSIVSVVKRTFSREKLSIHSNVVSMNTHHTKSIFLAKQRIEKLTGCHVSQTKLHRGITQVLTSFYSSVLDLWFYCDLYLINLFFNTYFYSIFFVVLISYDVYLTLNLLAVLEGTTSK